MRYILFDMETNGLYREATTHWVVSYMDISEPEKVYSIYTIEELRELFTAENTIFIGHNIIRFDFPLLNKLYGFDLDYTKVFDTLTLSYYLNPEKNRHGLAELGNKVEVEDEEWLVGDKELMTERCEGDVRDNFLVYTDLNNMLHELYKGEEHKIPNILNYIFYKEHCMKVQEIDGGIRLDIPLIEKTLGELQPIYDEKIETLRSVLPDVPVMGKKTFPKQKFKKDGDLTKNFENWLIFLEEQGIEEDFEGEVQYISGYKEPNPNSTQQKKEWLFSLGWVPEHFSYVREEDGSTRKIPQIKCEFVQGEVCKSIKALRDKSPEGIDALDSLSILKHRIDIFKGFLTHNIDGFVYPSSLGFTKTLRKKHRVLVNLPNTHTLFSENIRRSLIAREGHVLVGSDLAGIEDATKQHYIYPYDPEYVKEQMTEGFDSHMDIAKLAGLVSDEEINLWKQLRALDNEVGDKLNDKGKAELDRLEEIRDGGKLTNFSALYGVGIPTMSRSSGRSQKECEVLLDTYWERNWSVREFAKSLKTKIIRGNREYILNPINGYWYYLEFVKDKFSAVNQSSGQYILDTYIKLVSRKYKVLFQYHDELLIEVKKEDAEEAVAYLKGCIDSINNMLKLNVKVRASYKIGNNYAEV